MNHTDSTDNHHNINASDAIITCQYQLFNLYNVKGEITKKSKAISQIPLAKVNHWENERIYSTKWSFTVLSRTFKDFQKQVCIALVNLWKTEGS